MAYGFGYGFGLRPSSGPVESAPLPPDPTPSSAIQYNGVALIFIGITIQFN